MNIFHLVSNIHWIPVIVMTIFSFVLGFAWHQSFLFGKTWTKENQPNQDGKKMNIPLIFGGTAIVHFMAISALDAVVAGTGAASGLITGLVISIIWMLPALAGTYLFANRSLKLLAIDAGMYMVLFAVSGLILGVW